MSSQPLIQLTPDQQQQVVRIAHSTGKSPCQVVEEALDSLERQSLSPGTRAGESVHDALVRAGLLGCITDAPADLSTNPVYLEGFGGRG